MNNILIGLAEMLTKQVFLSKGFLYPDDIKYSVDDSNNVITAEYKNHRLVINPVEKTMILTETTQTMLFSGNKESGNDDSLPPPPAIAPYTGIDEENIGIDFYDEVDTRTLEEKMLPGILEKINQYKNTLGKVPGDIFYLNIDGTVCYPTNSSFDVVDRLWDSNLSENNQEELFDSCYDRIRGVEELSEYTLMVHC